MEAKSTYFGFGISEKGISEAHEFARKRSEFYSKSYYVIRAMTDIKVSTSEEVKKDETLLCHYKNGKNITWLKEQVKGYKPAKTYE